MLNDLELMELALSEARKCPRTVRPNPRVGCALQSAEGRVVSDHHKTFGGPHAERFVLDRCLEEEIDTKGAVVAINLEPCSHFGKTNPCVDALIEAKVRRVLIGVSDPNPLVNGKGIERLLENDIEVVSGFLEDQSIAVNREWLHAQNNKRPFITVKMATTMDGQWFGADGNSHWITSEKCREFSHQLRARVDAILSSATTIKKDNSAFTARLNDQVVSEEDQPKVYVLSRGERQSFDGLKIAEHPKGFEWIQKTEQLPVETILDDFFQAGVFDLMVEAGPRFTGFILNEFPVDEIHLYMGAIFLGQGRENFTQSLDIIGHGVLPGKQLKINKIEQIDEANILLVLQPKTK
jgi:diaminohydroxyphosphoribosylaminopyrimidine deaminase/5-amino-6-(5-phosphoribosylamino)uracil reductase